MMNFVKDRNGFALLFAGVSLIAMAPVTAHAADAAAADATAAADESNGSTITDIVVTGEKRTTTVQAAPLSITAVSSAALQQRDLNQVNQLNGYVPGLTVAKVRGSRTVASIRGIGYETANNPNSQPGVAFHIDGIYVAHVAALGQDLIDVDHIEVLRGPQGTVFGQTSTGGAINVISRKPILGEWHADASASYGNYNYFKSTAGVNIPLGDTIAYRGFLQYYRHDGYTQATAVKGYPGGYDLDDADNVAMRGTLLWQPSDATTVELAGLYFDNEIHGFAQKNILDPDPDPRRVTQDLAARYRLKTRMGSVSISQDIGDFATVKSVTAWQYMNRISSAENDMLASPTYYDHLEYWQDKSTAFTQELTAASKPGTQLEWIVGGFYLRQRALQKIDERSNVPSIAPTLKYATDSPFQHSSWAAFGQATFHATDDLAFIAGARYSWDLTTAQPFNFYGGFGLVAPRRTTSNAVTGKVSAEYNVTPTSKIYITGSKGYKPNGLNFNGTPLVVKTQFEKETIYAAEIGSKNQFFDRKLTFNTSAYHYWYENFQFASEDPRPNQSGTTNIPQARIYGIEFESSAAPAKWVRFDGNLSLSRGRFHGDFFTIDAQTAGRVRSFYSTGAYGGPPLASSNATVISAVGASQFNTNGGRLPKLPGVQGQFSTSLFADVAGGDLTVRGEVVYRGKFSVRVFDTAALDRVPAYTIANAYVEWKPQNSPFTFSVSANNLFDNAGVASIFTDPNGSLQTSREYIAPRQVFGTVAVRF
jgi:iron complex outermembrane receptor protein